MQILVLKILWYIPLYVALIEQLWQYRVIMSCLTLVSFLLLLQILDAAFLKNTYFGS